MHQRAHFYVIPAPRVAGAVQGGENGLVKVTSSPTEGSQVVLEMEIESERVEMAMERAYRRLVSRVNIPGFRKGKAPRHLVERMLGREALMNEALDILVPEAYEEAVQETGIDPVSHPHMDIVSAEPLSVKATVPVRPTFQLGNYRSIRQSEEPVEINESQVDEAIERVRDARAEWHKVERGVQSGDMVSMDITARTDTKTFVDGKSQRVIVDPERPIVAAGVAEEIIGMMAGDQKAFDVTLPEDFGDTEIAGQEAAVEVSVTEIREKVVPELNDELSHAVGGFGSVEEMRTTARTEIESQSKARSRQELEESVLSAVVDQTDMELPAAWVEEQAGILLENAKRRLGREGLTIEQFLRFSNLTEEKYREELESTARRQLKRTLVLDAVADAEEIGVSDEEVDAAFQVSISDQQGQAANVDVNRTKANIREVLKERKTVQRLLEIAGGQEAGDSEPDAPSAGQATGEAEAGEPSPELEPVSEKAQTEGEQ